MTPIRSVWLSAIVVGLLLGCASTTPESESAASLATTSTPPTVSPAPPPAVAPEDFAILPWGQTPGDPELLAGIRECGFNLAGFVAPDDLDAVRAAGLKAFVIDRSIRADGKNLSLPPAEIETRVRTLTDKVGTHPAVYGYYLRDEPPSVDYPGLKLWADAVRAADPDAVPYINLFPNYVPLAAIQSWGLKNYDDYVERYIETVKPPFVSYDHYALMDDGTLRGGYFQNLESVRAAALKHGIPFWNIVLGNSHFHYAEPSPAGLRFQAYTTLAYGARGISYFTYFSPDIGNYRLAPVDAFRHKTPTWDMMRDVNLQIQKLAPTYIALKSVNVFHHPTVPEDCRGLDSSRWIQSIEGGEFVVGEFEGPDGTPYAMVVNKDLHTSCAFSVRFKTEGPILQLNAYTGQPREWEGENNWLAAGQGMLLYVKQAKD